MTVSIEKFKGHDVISLSEAVEPGKFGTRLTMGVKKAKLVLKHIDEIEKFVEKYGGEEHGAGNVGEEADN